MLGILLINKPEGMTSHDVVQKVRRALGTKRVGHAGTLDPIATGLLVMAVGHATRFLQYLNLEPKEYDCTFRFGIETNTYDTEGEVTSTSKVGPDLEQKIRQEIGQFLGKIHQVPPIYSAIKKDGKPLYAYARSGETVEVQGRSVTIHDFEILEIRDDEADFRITCSSGTYIRSLANDLGKATGYGAHVSELQRTKVGIYDIDDSVELEEVSAEYLIPLSTALSPTPLIALNSGQVDRIFHGQWIKPNSLVTSHTVGLTDNEGQVIAVGRVEDSMIHPICVIPRDALHDSL